MLLAFAVVDSVKVKGALAVYPPDIEYEPLAVMRHFPVPHVHLLPLGIILWGDGFSWRLLFLFALLPAGWLRFISELFCLGEWSRITGRLFVVRAFLGGCFSQRRGGQEEGQWKGDEEEVRVKPHIAVCKGGGGLTLNELLLEASI